jgi:hypothetical protein
MLLLSLPLGEDVVVGDVVVDRFEGGARVLVTKK